MQASLPEPQTLSELFSRIKGLIKGVNTVNPVYEVRSPGGNVRRIKAKNSTAAKREYCRRLGIRPSDYWCGMTALTARRVKDE